jgi:hypothetical protein
LIVFSYVEDTLAAAHNLCAVVFMGIATFFCQPVRQLPAWLYGPCLIFVVIAELFLTLDRTAFTCASADFMVRFRGDGWPTGGAAHHRLRSDARGDPSTALSCDRRSVHPALRRACQGPVVET